MGKMSRPATISPSQLDCLMAKSGLGAGAETYADKIVMRILGVDFSDEYESWDMKRGTELESDAVLLYERYNYIELPEKKRIWHHEYDYVSGEPDGLVGDDGLIEIKCPRRKWHLANLRDGTQVSNYMNQMQGYMWITGREWCDFISYDPRFPKDLRMYVQRVDRDEEIISMIEDRCIEFWKTIVIPKAKEFDIELEKVAA